MQLDDIRNSSFTILGAGRSGIAIARLLKETGAEVFLSDASPVEKLTYFDPQLLDDNEIDYEIGGHTGRAYESDVVIKSPGIPMDNEVIVKSLEAGKKVVSEIEAAYWFCKAPVIAITGTNGKTTTTVLTGEILKNAGKDAKVCGNVGLAFSQIVSEVKEDSIVVLEVSSFQLETIEDFKPRVAAFLNFKEDHLDWHKTVENYMTAKMKITMNQDKEELFVYNVDDEDIVSNVKTKARRAGFGLNKELVKSSCSEGCYIDNEEVVYFKNEMETRIINTGDIFIKGMHNVYNVMASIISVKEFGVSDDIIRQTLTEFKGVEHRIEFVRDIDGIKFYNDSKATNVESTKMALMSFDKNIVLILGGQGKANFDSIKDLVKERAKKVIAVGETADIVEDTFKSVVNTKKYETFDEAVKGAYSSAVSGDVVLLSPAHKSFDLFKNFEERGKEFKRIVNSL